MKELTREELPTDSTNFVVTCEFNGENWAETCTFCRGEIRCSDDCPERFSPVAFPDGELRFWQFPEGETT